MGELALVGKRSAVAEVFGLSFSGFFGLGDVARGVPLQDAEGKQTGAGRD
jgi:hypothetical protein